MSSIHEAIIALKIVFVRYLRIFVWPRHAYTFQSVMSFSYHFIALSHILWCFLFRFVFFLPHGATTSFCATKIARTKDTNDSARKYVFHVQFVIQIQWFFACANIKIVFQQSATTIANDIPNWYYQCMRHIIWKREVSNKRAGGYHPIYPHKQIFLVFVCFCSF